MPHQMANKRLSRTQGPRRALLRRLTTSVFLHEHTDTPLPRPSGMRSFIGDAITPISAFLALAQPGRSCLLESVEGMDRISRYSFIGIDYLESRVFDDEPAMLDGIRALVGKYDIDTSAL